MKLKKDNKILLTNIEIDNYFNELNNDISEKILEGLSLRNIAKI